MTAVSLWRVVWKEAICVWSIDSRLDFVRVVVDSVNEWYKKNCQKLYSFCVVTEIHDWRKSFSRVPGDVAGGPSNQITVPVSWFIGSTYSYIWKWSEWVKLLLMMVSTQRSASCLKIFKKRNRVRMPSSYLTLSLRCRWRGLKGI